MMCFSTEKASVRVTFSKTLLLPSTLLRRLTTQKTRNQLTGLTRRGFLTPTLRRYTYSLILRLGTHIIAQPEDWDETEPYEIPDEDAVKPEGWLDDEPLNIPDPDAEKPEEWDDEEDGDWIAPTVHNPACDEAPGCGEWKRPYKANPKYKGKWYAPMIDNPAYIGEWSPRKISNPDYFEDLEPVKHLNKIVRIFASFLLY